MRISLKPHRLWTRRRTNIIKSSTTISFSPESSLFSRKRSSKTTCGVCVAICPSTFYCQVSFRKAMLGCCWPCKVSPTSIEDLFQWSKASSPTTESFLKIVSEKWKPSFPLYLILHPVTDGLGSQKRTEEKEEPLLSFLPKKVSKCIRKLLREERHKSCLSETISATK